ncbi:hypothetical protein [Woodsholea maritima]|uniref:hypothetical protein n=1 Tax=Woodsholea maritima TaxID=240237 RepID=UPI0003756546|nr:hypothetical protein [Woodsholea maritima]
MAFDQNQSRNKCIKDAAFGGLAGLVVAIGLILLMSFIMGGNAHGQERDSRESRVNPDASYLAALTDCQAGTRMITPSASTLGACDYALNASTHDTRKTAEILIDRAIIALNRNEIRPALADLERAISLEPDMAVAHLNLAAAAIKAGQFQRALGAAEAALSLNISDPALAHYNRAIALEGLRLWDEAYLAYGEAAALAPDNVEFAAQPRRFRQHQG